MAVYTASETVSVAAAAAANTFYVDPDGTNADGLTQASAWTDWDQVDWSSIPAGSEVRFYPGTYSTQIRPTAGGSAGNPIVLRGVGTDADTPAIVQGSRGTQLLPQCGESGWTAETATEYGIWIDQDYIEIDGTSLKGLQIRGWKGHGIRVQNNVDGLLLRNIEAYNNGWVTLVTGWDSVTYGTNIAFTNGAGLFMGGFSPRVERCIFHDNGQDGVQSLAAPNNLDSPSFRQVWCYNHRQHTISTGSPTDGPGTQPFNWGSHPDGIQIYDGGTVDGIDAEDCWFGPGLMNCLVFGDSSTSTVCTNVTLTDVTLDRGTYNCLLSQPPQANDDMVLNRTTIVGPNSSVHVLYTDADDLTVNNTLVEALPATVGDVDINGTGNSYSNNYYYNVTLNSGTSGFATQTSSTIFPDADLSKVFDLNDYTPSTEVSGAGSNNRTVQEMFGIPNYTITGPNTYGQYTFVAPSTSGSGSSGGGETEPETTTYSYPLNTAYVRVVRPVSDVLTRVKRSMRDPDNKRWTDQEILDAVNRSLDTWANRVYVPCVFDIEADIKWDQVSYPIPYYIRQPFTIQRRLEQWYWLGGKDSREWSEVHGGYVIPDGKGGQTLNLDAGGNWMTTEDMRILWHAEVGHIPTFDVKLSAALDANSTTLTVDSPLIDTIGDVGFVLVGQELMQYSGVTETPTTTTLHELVRGTNNTTIDEHAAATAVEWCIPYVDSSLYTVLIDQVKSYMQLFYMTDSSARETEHHQWLLRWHQQLAEDFWSTWLPNRDPSVKLSRSAIIDGRY